MNNRQQLRPNDRLTSLDAFRGIAVACMILVNYPGSWRYVYPPLRPADWHGWTPTDLVFPFFLFIVGVSMSFSMAKRIQRGDTRGQILAKVAWRATVLLGIGLVLNLIPDWDWRHLRIPGVLQRIAVCSFFVSLILLGFGKRLQVAWAILLLAAYGMAIRLIPVPGFGAGVLDPDGNLCRYLDGLILKGHTWDHPVAGFDPEGLLSTLSAMVTILLGVFAGDGLRSGRSACEKLGGLFVWANLGLIAGWVLGFWMPINKHLWTGSFVLFTAGVALHALAMCYYLVEVRQWQVWARPFVALGRNAILIYVLSWMAGYVLDRSWVVGVGGVPVTLHRYWFELLALQVGTLNGSLLYAWGCTVFWMAVASVLHQRRVFLSL